MDTYETSIYHAVLISGIVIGGIIIYLLVSITRQKLQNARLQRSNLLKEMNLLEAERRRVANDLHDELGTLLTLAKSHISQLKPSAEKEVYHQEMAGEQIRQVVKRMGEIAINLRPGALERKGLDAVLLHYFEELEEASGILFDFKCEQLPSISLESSIHIYRIIQEASHNALKHAQCSNIELHIKSFPRKTALLFRDDGKGYVKEEAGVNGNGQGLGSMKNRTEILGGKMLVKTAPGKGTEYYFEFPNSHLQYDKNTISR